MNIKEIIITTTIKTKGEYCSTEEITWSDKKSRGPLSCDFNGTRRHGQGCNMSDPEVEWWDFNYCYLFKLDLQLDKDGYPKRCQQCLMAEKVADGD